ncbi:type VI secretion-associated protein [Desulfuromonas versatilis]|uniref:Type VI secretion-associated protein n=1 Tax=Desulfuromonas versatilis TaxID=2802975 RepID=A0ABM8HQE2_9BACT|nr:type VI secretion system protein TssA [Desulfuromonas versatilis]BCR03017.1 type VI secretion-associated protein [Desulfuromonas versatilis]
MSQTAAATPLQAPFPVWLATLGAPLPGADPCGEDSRYGDAFALIKQEIDKLQGNDYPRVAALCRQVLAEQSKDLRVAGYLLLAALYTEGAAGLLEAARAYRIVWEDFGDDCFPKKPGGRIAALQWLNNPRLESFARQHAGEASRAQLLELRQLIDTINQASQAALGESAPLWSGLDKWLKTRLGGAPSASPEPPGQTEPQRASGPAPAPVSPARPAESALPVAAVGSERELTQATRAIRDYLLQRKEYLQAAAYARALRWGALVLPPHQQGHTRAPAPRRSGLNELSQLQQGGEYDAAFRLCENLFLEPGGHLCLDLQRHAAAAARGMGRTELAEFIVAQAAALVQRLPELPGLYFETGEPFADGQTRGLLEPASAASAPLPQAQGREDWELDLLALLEAARDLVSQKKLPAALGLLKTCPVPGEKQRLCLRLASARLCFEAGRPEIALPLLDELEVAVASQSLYHWEPALVQQIWGLLLETLQSLLQKAAGGGKEQLTERLAALRARICRTDPEAAARLLRD